MLVLSSISQKLPGQGTIAGVINQTGDFNASRILIIEYLRAVWSI